MKEFADLTDGGRQLAGPLGTRVDLAEAILAPILPNGVPVALGIVEELPLSVVPLQTTRTDEGIRVGTSPEHLTGTVIVVDDGVETGTAARAAAQALREVGVDRVILAVPVCPREALADLALRYDDVVAVSTPMVRRSLTWHYEDFDSVDEAEALRRLEGHAS